MKAIKTKYHGYTNHRPSRISARDGAGHSVMLSFDHEYDGERNHQLAAIALCRKMNWSVNIRGGGYKGAMYWVFI